MNDDHDLPIEKEKPKNKPKRGARSRWLIAWLALGLTLSGVLVFLNAPRMVGQPEPTMTWTWWPEPTFTPTMLPAVAATVFASQSGTDTSSSVSVWGNQLAQVEWKERNLRWRSFTADDSGQWSVTSGGDFQFPHRISQAAISADGRWLLVTVAHDDQSRTHLMRTDGKLSTWWVESNAAALQPNGTEAIIDQINGHLAYYALRENAIINTMLPSNVPRVQALALQGRRLVVLGSDGIVRYDNLTDPTTITRAALITDEPPYAVALLPDGRAAVLTSSEVVVYDFQGGYQRYALPQAALQRPDALIASSTQPRLAVRHAYGLTLIRADNGSPLTPDANRAAVTFWEMQGVRAAAFLPDSDRLVLSFNTSFGIVYDMKVLQWLPDEWPIDPIGLPSGR